VENGELAALGMAAEHLQRKQALAALSRLLSALWHREAWFPASNTRKRNAVAYRYQRKAARRRSATMAAWRAAAL
jgi:hypothetical protein